MGLHHSYTLLSPFYDPLVAKATQKFRKTSLNKVTLQTSDTILISGIGSGLDIPLLHAGPNYYGIDLTPSMLRRAQHRKQSHKLNIRLQQGDVMQLPYQDNSFDLIIMHLILAVAPDPIKTLQEAQRTLKPGGTILILDKFLKPGQLAPIRRLLNLVIKRIATRLDVIFEDVLSQCTQLQLIENSAADKSGWFRHIMLKKI
jgi:ubiquinone/menaquinone biosynthesis C-methylase UbiE